MAADGQAGHCRRLAAETPCPRRGDCRCPPTGNAVSTAGAKGDVGHLRFPMSPLDTPLTFRWPLSEAFAAKRGLRGLGSVRRFAYGTLSGPEVSLRDLPRITVRGQTVQGGSVPLRKAPLPSSVDPWSTRRLCGSLAFRRATEGSRVLRRFWGSQEGAREPYGALAPFCSCRWAPASPPPGGGNARPAHRQSVSPPAAHRCIGGDQPSAEGKEKRAAYGVPSADGKKKNAPAFAGAERYYANTV